MNEKKFDKESRINEEALTDVVGGQSKIRIRMSNLSFEFCSDSTGLAEQKKASDCMMVFCPQCGAPLNIVKSGNDESKLRDISTVCPGCGENVTVKA